LQSLQESKPATNSATFVQPTPTPLASPSPASLRSTAENPVHPPSPYDDIVVTAVGDVMLGTTFPDESALPPNDGADLLTEVTPFLKRGDVVYGNLEGPIVDGGESAKCRGKKIGTCFAFRVPTRYGKYLKDAGFTAMGLANNHAMDFGLEGRASSRQVLDAIQIAHTGEVGDIARLNVKGRRISIIAFATYPGAYNFLDLDESLQTIRSLKAESELVIVGFHGGAEGATHQHVLEGDELFLGEDRGDLRRFTHAAIDAGADLVLGSGPHVVRAMEIYKGKLIAYSLGNFATYGPFNLNAENGLTLVLEAHLAPDGTFLRGKAYSVKQEKPGGPKMDPERKILPILRSLSVADFKETAISVGPQGELWLPGTEPPPCLNAPDLLEQRPGAASCGIFP
jgi:Bacterial capsule synthesis protein PGA_cap